MNQIAIQFDGELKDGNILIYKNKCFHPISKEKFLNDLIEKQNQLEQEIIDLKKAINDRLKSQHEVIKEIINK